MLRTVCAKEREEGPGIGGSVRNTRVSQHGEKPMGRVALAQRLRRMSLAWGKARFRHKVLGPIPSTAHTRPTGTCKPST